MPQEIPTIEASDKFNFFTSIWIVPLVALFIAFWLAYQYYSELGPLIRITFNSNEGLKAGQSLVKYKDVPIGKVTKIHLQEEGEGVVVDIRMDKNAKKYLNEHTKFWIVKPEVSLGGVKGLDTLITGTYIGMYTQRGYEYIREFRGLPNTYREDKAGEYFTLRAPDSVNIKPGTPVYFKNMEVGRVEYIAVSLDGKSIEFYVFIERQFVPYIHDDSKFWIRSAVDMEVINGKLDVHVAPLTHLIQGGISFSSTGEDETKRVPDRYVFHLYNTKSAAEEKRISHGEQRFRTYEVHFPYSIAKLDRGASVLFEQYAVGEVLHTMSYYNAKSHIVSGIVYLKIDTSFFQDINEEAGSGEKHFVQAIEDGLSASLHQANPVSGALQIDLVFKDQNITIGHSPYTYAYNVLPALPEGPVGISRRVEQFLDKLDTLVGTIDHFVTSTQTPLVQSLNDLNESVHAIRDMTTQQSFVALPQTIEGTLTQIDDTFKEAEVLAQEYRTDSMVAQQASDMMRVMTETADELKKFLQMLNRKPDALLLGDD